MLYTRIARYERHILIHYVSCLFLSFKIVWLHPSINNVGNFRSVRGKKLLSAQLGGHLLSQKLVDGARRQNLH